MGILDGLKDKVDDVLEKTDIDDKIKAKAQDVLDKTDIDDKIKGAAGELKDKAAGALEKTDLDEKVGAAAKKMKNKVQDVMEKTELDEKIKAGTTKLREKAAASGRDVGFLGQYRFRRGEDENGSFFVFAAMTVLSVFLGRAWCGWLCPAGGSALFEATLPQRAHTSRRLPAVSQPGFVSSC